MARTTEHFVAVADDGQSIIIIFEQDSIALPGAHDPNTTVAGHKRAFTESGERCEQIDEQTWHIPSIGLVRRI